MIAIGLTAVLLALVAGIYLLLWRGWRRRRTRHAGLPELPLRPPAARFGDVVEGSYVSTTGAGDRLDRIVAHGLGVRGEASLAVGAEGLLIERTGAADIFVPTDALRGVRLDAGIAGKVTGGEGILVVTWNHRGTALDTGFHPRQAADRDRLLREIGALIPERSTL